MRVIVKMIVMVIIRVKRKVNIMEIIMKMKRVKVIMNMRVMMIVNIRIIKVVIMRMKIVYINGNDNGNSKSENSVYWCFDEASE
jgi:hypothetical protein